VQSFIDMEELADEVFEVGGDGDDQFGLLFDGDGGSVQARGHKLTVQVGRSFLEFLQEDGIQPGEGVPVVEVLKRESEGQRKGAVTPRVSLLIHDWLIPDTGCGPWRRPRPLYLV